MSTFGDTENTDSKDKVMEMEQANAIEGEEIIQNVESEAQIDELNAVGGARTRIYTDKGRQLSEEQIIKSFNSVKKISTQLNQMLANKDSNEQIRLLYCQWMQCYEQFSDLHNKHVPKLKESDKEEYLLSHDQRETFLINIKKAVQDYLKTTTEIQQKTVPNSNIDNRSVKSGSRSSISSKRLEAEEKRIELEAKKQALKRKSEIEMAKIKLKMEEEELNIETDIAVADAKAKVYDQLELGEIDNVPVKVELKTKQIKHVNNDSNQLNPHARDFIPVKPKLEDSVSFPLLDFPKYEPVKFN